MLIVGSFIATLMKKTRNTYRSGRLTFICYKTKKNTYIAACDELCILVEDKDDELAKLKMMSKSKFYLESVIKGKLGEHLLNQSLPAEIKKEFVPFWKKEQAEKWSILQKSLLRQKDNNLCIV